MYSVLSIQDPARPMKNRLIRQHSPKAWISAIGICLLLSIPSFAQVSLIVHGGLGKNSGALAYPYHKPDPWLTVPYSVEVEMNYQIKPSYSVSLFAQRAVNEKGEGFLGSVSVDAETQYYGLRYGRHIAKHVEKRTEVLVGLSSAYGLEKIHWKDEDSFPLFGRYPTVEGNDTFHLLRMGFFISTRFTVRRMIMSFTFEPTQDFVLSSTRSYTPSTREDNDEIERFLSRGLTSAQLRFGIGFFFLNN